MTYLPGPISLPLCLEWNDGSYFTADNRRPTTVTNAFAFTRVYSWWCSLNCSRREWTCLRQQSITVVCIQRVATYPLFHSRHSKINTISLTLNIALHQLLQSIVQSLWIWNVQKNVKIYNNISSRYCRRFNVFSLLFFHISAARKHQHCGVLIRNIRHQTLPTIWVGTFAVWSIQPRGMILNWANCNHCVVMAA